MFSKLSRLAAAAAVATVLAAGPAVAQTKMIVNNDTGSVSLKGQTWEHFKQLVEERLGDEVTVELHHGGALYSQKTMLQAVQLGAIHAIAPVVGVFTGTFPKLAVLTLPFLLTTPTAIEAAMNDEAISAELFDDLREQGVEPVAVWLNGPRNVGRKGQPVLTPADMKGVKIRVPGGSNYVEAFRAVGANVITMDWGEVPTALQQGVIDAVEPTPNAWLSSRLFEIADHITDTGYIYDFYIVGLNKAWWDGLSPNVREELQTIMDETTKWNWENTDRVNAEAEEKMTAEGATIHKLTDEQRSQWKEAMRPVWDKLGRSLIGDEVMERLIEIGEQNG